MPQSWNDWLALLLLLVIPGLWGAQGLGWMSLEGEVNGALIAGWMLVLQFYFRKAKPETPDIPPANPPTK